MDNGHCCTLSTIQHTTIFQAVNFFSWQFTTLLTIWTMFKTFCLFCSFSNWLWMKLKLPSLEYYFYLRPTLSEREQITSRINSTDFIDRRFSEELLSEHPELAIWHFWIKTRAVNVIPRNFTMLGEGPYKGAFTVENLLRYT